MKMQTFNLDKNHTQTQQNIMEKKNRKLCIAIIDSNCSTINLDKVPELIDVELFDDSELKITLSSTNPLKPVVLSRLDIEHFPYIPYCVSSSDIEKKHVLMMKVYSTPSILLSDIFATIVVLDKNDNFKHGPLCKKHINLVGKKYHPKKLFTKNFRNYQKRINRSGKRRIFLNTKEELVSIHNKNQPFFDDTISIKIMACCECEKSMHSLDMPSSSVTTKSFIDQTYDEIPCHCSFCLKLAVGLNRRMFNSEIVQNFFPNLFENPKT